MTKKLQMTFALDTGKTLLYSLPDPKEGLKKADVEAVMTQMIEKKAVTSPQGTPVGIKEILIRSTEETTLA